jgi:hypothetical protein
VGTGSRKGYSFGDKGDWLVALNMKTGNRGELMRDGYTEGQHDVLSCCYAKGGIYNDRIA